MNFFTFFTVLSNVLLLTVFLIGTARWRTTTSSPVFDLVRGAATLYIVVTGVVFALLLAGLQEQLQTTVPWVDAVLHKVMPAAGALDWLIDPPRTRLSVRAAATWLAFPAVWLAYTLLRGPIANWHPYPFVDPRTHGYAHVVFNCFFILLGFVGLTALIASVGNRPGAWRDVSRLGRSR